MTDRDALRDALAEALSHLGIYDRGLGSNASADAILAHPAVAAALAGSGPDLDAAYDSGFRDGRDACIEAGSGPEAGLREAAYVKAYVEDRDRYIREALVERVGDMVGRQAALDVIDASWRAALAATPTASPTDGLREGEASATQSLLSNQPLRGGHRVRAHSTGEDSTLREVYLAAAPTASPTACDRLCIHVEGCDRAASPTATGEREQ